MNNAKKVLIFSTSYYPFVAGAEVAIKEITDRIQGVDFDLITGRFDKSLPRNEKIGSVNVFRVGIGAKTFDKLLLPFWGSLLTLKLHRKNNYTLFWCVMATFASGAAYIANILNLGKKVPTVLTLQEGDSEEHFKSRWFGLIDVSWKLALKRTQFLTVLSSYLEDRARRKGYKGEIKVVPNGVNTKLFDTEILKNERLKIREELGLEEGDIGLVTTSRLVLKNGVGDVIDALSKLPENIKFIVFGEGYLEEKLKLEARSLNLDKRVKFMGYVDHKEMPKYLKACDIFIRASLSEGFGNSFIEAMAVGLPVIATRVGGIPDFLFDEPMMVGERTGYFCKPNDAQSIVDTVMRVISDQDKNQVVENSKRMVREKYDWDIVASKMKEVFERF